MRMNRLNKYLTTLGSGYISLIVNAIYTFASVPLALTYLSKAEFGLWALTVQLAGYISILDFGITGASARIVIDYKDAVDSDNYGRFVRTTVLVNIVQGILVLVPGILFAIYTPHFLQVPAELTNVYIYLIIGHCGLQFISFSTRIFSILLSAHQRYYIVNYANVLMFAISFAVLWIGFRCNLGVMSLLWAQAAGQLFMIIPICLGCRRYALWPISKARPSWIAFKDIFVFSKDVFIYAIGSQMISASQTILISYELGLASAAVWSVCTRVFTMMIFVIQRIYDFAQPVLTEMYVRCERQQLYKRFSSIVSISLSLTVLMSVLIASCNAPFVHLWTYGKISWSFSNDILLGCILIISIFARALVVMDLVRKDFHILKYIYIGEGAIFILLSLATMPSFGMSGVLLSSIVSTLCITLPYGVYRDSKYFNISYKVILIGWAKPAMQLLLLMLLPLLFVYFVSTEYDNLSTLLIRGLSLGIIGVCLLWWFGIEVPLKQELAVLCKGSSPWLQAQKNNADI